VAIALGEAAGQVLEALGGARPSLVLASVTPPHLGTLEDVGAALRTLLAPEVVAGAVAPAVIGGGRHVEGGPALALFAVAGVAAAPLSLVPDADGRLRRHGHLDQAAAAVVLADPFSCSPPDLVGVLQGVPVGGGLVGARGPGGSRLLLDDAVRTSGAVGALLGVPAQVLASQGATPVGEAWAVTRSAPHMVLELGGRAASVRQAEALGEEGASGAAALGLVLDERSEDLDRSQLLAVPILGPAKTGGIHVARTIPVGRVVRFLRTGPSEVEADVVATLGPFAPGPVGALLFPADGRHGDADLVSDLLGCPVGGVAVSAPLAPLAHRPHLHGPGSTSMVVFP
jgi:small ligand-binding sensory domain FIST